MITRIRVEGFLLGKHVKPSERTYLQKILLYTRGMGQDLEAVLREDELKEVNNILFPSKEQHELDIQTES